ncbi:MAG: UDP-N-acetylmuramate--L-alanine ligase [Clostridia bacterium]|nr:UDP-N-acetylmuramate--L-alanine ligase [Clostridia bacterium]
MKIVKNNILPEGASSVFFIGICGISMSSLASITHQNGMKVGGSDTNDGDTARDLREKGIDVRIGHSAENVKGYDAVVYTAAISAENPELVYAREHNIPCINRADYLGSLMLAYTNRIGVAGMHGKSTVTGMISHVFIEANKEPTVLNGANTVELGGGAYRIGRNDGFIFEACEYKDSFLSFHPDTAVLLNLEMDHVDYFHSLQQVKDSFEKYANKAKTVVACGNDENLMDALKNCTSNIVTYGKDDDSLDFCAYDIKENKYGYNIFKIAHKGEFLCDVELSVPGEHNVLNTTAAIAVGYLNGIDAQEAAKSMASFKGVNRRAEYKGEVNGVVIYDDYAHHPSEIMSSIHGLKKLCNCDLWCIYQPHTYSRTAGLFEEFCASFGEADKVIFAEIYAAREVNTFGISSKNIADRIEGALYFETFEEIADYVNKNAKPGDLVVTMGAGDIFKMHKMLLK